MSGPKGGSVNLVSALLDLAALATAESDWQTVLRTSRTDISSMNSAQASAAACVKSGATDEVSKKYAEGEFGLREAERLQKEAQNARNRVSASSSTSRQTRDINDAAAIMRRASRAARDAKSAFDQTAILAQERQKREERERELKRSETANKIQEAKSEAAGFSEQFLAEWGGDESALNTAKQTLQNAETKLQSDKFDEAQRSAADASSQFNALYKKALNNKQQFGNREKITDAIVAALNELQYDEPDVNYEPKEGTENTMLGNVTIFAKSKGESGDMRLAIDLDGKVNLEVADIPEGKETECHKAITNLQSLVADTVDFQMTDWGRAKNVKDVHGGGLPPKQQVAVKEQVKHRGV